MDLNSQQSSDFINRMKTMLTLNGSSRSDDDNTRVLFRNIFIETPGGRECLSIILDMLQYNEKIVSPYELSLHNVAVEILNILGVNSTIDIVNSIK